MKRKLVIAAAILVVLVLTAAAWLVFKIEHRVEGEYFDADGVRIHYTVEGAGEPVVLVHGFAANADLNWRHPGVTRALAEDYKVIALDDRGHGLSGKPHDPAKYGIEMVEDIVRLLDHLGIEKAHVAGYSMGGFITLKLLILHPERLLSAAPCGSGWGLMDPDNKAMLDGIVQAIADDADFGPLLAALEPGGKKVGRLKTFGANLAIPHFNDTEALAAVMKSFMAFSVTEEELRANQVPVLSIVGSEDPLKRGVDALTGVLSNHETVIIDGADHMTAPARREFVSALKEFFAKAQTSKE